MKTIAIIAQVLLCTLLSFAQNGPSKGDARVGQINGKLVFFSCDPASPFTKLMTVKGLAGTDLDEIAERCYNKIIKQVKVESFDALLISSYGNYGIALKFNSPDTTGRDLAKVNKEKAKYVFVRNQPLAPYDAVGEYEFVAYTGDMTNSLPEQALMKAFKLGYEFDGIIMYGRKKAIAIKFKE